MWYPDTYQVGTIHHNCKGLPKAVTLTNLKLGKGESVFRRRNYAMLEIV